MDWGMWLGTPIQVCVTDGKSSSFFDRRNVLTLVSFIVIILCMLWLMRSLRTLACCVFLSDLAFVMMPSVMNDVSFVMVAML